VALWSSLGFPVVRQRALSRRGAAHAFRLDLLDGESVKGRIFATPAWAARVERLLELPRAYGLPRPLRRSGRFMVLEFVEGTPLDEWLPHHPHGNEAAAVRAAGAWLAQLHRGARLADRAPGPARYEQRMRAVLRWVRRAALLAPDVVDELWNLRAPSRAAVAVTHGDICPENLIRTPDGTIRPIDEERLAVRPLAYDLARTINCRPLDDRLERTFLEGYLSAGGRPQGFLRHRSFWIAAALATSAEYRWQHPARLRPILAAMRDLCSKRT
jgi:aminoglycoside phosphotransferase (APT) family kinase protein